MGLTFLLRYGDTRLPHLTVSGGSGGPGFADPAVYALFQTPQGRGGSRDGLLPDLARLDSRYPCCSGSPCGVCYAGPVFSGCFVLVVCVRSWSSVSNLLAVYCASTDRDTQIRKFGMHKSSVTTLHSAATYSQEWMRLYSCRGVVKVCGFWC